jgi:hypothetical protein
MQRKFFLIAFLFLSSLAHATSQTSVSAQTTTTSDMTIEESSDGWTFYLDEENKVYYIDFETINVNLSDIKVINEAGEVVLNDTLWNLPVNTIYELDMKEMKPGRYIIQLGTYTGFLQKDLKIS